MGRVFSQDVINAYPELDKYSLILIAAKMVRKGLAHRSRSTSIPRKR